MRLSIKHLNPPTDFQATIFTVVKQHENLRTKIKLTSQSLLAITSFVAFFPLGSAVAQAFSNSSFSEYVSLLFSGDTAVMTYWQELTFSIIESLPILSLTLFLFATIVFLYSLTRALRNGRQFLLLRPIL